MDEAKAYHLLALAQAGDHEAFALLHDQLAPPLTRFAFRLLGDAQDAEDVVQDTLMTLYLHLSDIDPPEKLRPYVYRVARNRCYDRLRRSGRYEQMAMEDDEQPLSVRVSFIQSAQDVAPDDAAHWLLLQLEVWEAIARLPELQRQTLTLYAEDGMSYAEIAEVMNVSIGTVKSRLFNAKQSLRRMLPRSTVLAIEGDDSL